MTRRPATDVDITAALKAHLPSGAPADLRERIRLATSATRQERRLPRLLDFASARPAIARYAIAAAAALVVAVVGSGLLGFGVTAPVSPIREGPLPAGHYAAHPLPVPHNGLTVKVTLPAGWEAQTDPGGLGLGLVPANAQGPGAPGGMHLQFIDVTTLNDPCSWSGTDDDVEVGPSVDDLVAALQAETAYEVSRPVDVRIGGYAGKRVDVVMPTERFLGQSATAVGCDNSVFRPWNTSAHGDAPLYAQGPANRWQTNILDIDGTRLVVVVADFPATPAADRAVMDAIVASLDIDP